MQLMMCSLVRLQSYNIFQLPLVRGHRWFQRLNSVDLETLVPRLLKWSLGSTGFCLTLLPPPWISAFHLPARSDSIVLTRIGWSMPEAKMEVKVPSSLPVAEGGSKTGGQGAELLQVGAWATSKKVGVDQGDHGNPVLT